MGPVLIRAFEHARERREGTQALQLGMLWMERGQRGDRIGEAVGLTPPVEFGQAESRLRCPDQVCRDIIRRIATPVHTRQRQQANNHRTGVVGRIARGE